MLSNLKTLFKLKQTPLVGIDIGETTVKLLELSRCNQGGYRIEAYASADLPPHPEVEGDGFRHPSRVRQAIAEAVAASHTQQQYAALCLSGAPVVTRIISVSAAFSDNEIIEHIELEAEHMFPYPLEEVYYDFEILGPNQKDPAFIDVLLAGARVERVESRIEVLEGTGMKATVMDVEAFAVQRAFNFMLKQWTKDTENMALFDLGTTVTTLHVFKNSHPLYSRAQTFGVKQLSDEMERRYGLFMTETGVATDAGDAFSKYGDLPEDYRREVLEPFKESVINQLNRALQTFISSTDEITVNELVLSGTGAKLPELAESINTKTGIKTIVANPFINMQFSDNVNQILLMEEAPSLMLSLGLALRNFEE